MPPPPASGIPNPIRRRGFRFLPPLLLALAAGCATPSSGPDHRALRPPPAIAPSPLRADQALVDAFFAAHGVRLSSEQLERILPPAAPFGHIDRTAIRDAAAANRRLLLVVKADEDLLWSLLGQNLPVLILMPPGVLRDASVTPLVPIAWDRRQRTLDLLDGDGEIHPFSESDFFVLREPLKQAALCLVKPGALGRFQPTRDQKLLLADFWFDQGAYRRAAAAYADIQRETPAGVDLDALVGQGNVLFQRGRHQDAIPVFRQALALAPDNPRILNNLAYALLHGDGELTEALTHASRAAQLDPHNPLVLETLGSIHLRLGDPLAAARILEQAWARALRRSPDVQIAIMDQLVRAWHAADRDDLAWQVANHRRRSFPTHRIPHDILLIFPSLKDPAPSITNSPPL